MSDDGDNILRLGKDKGQRVVNFINDRAIEDDPCPVCGSTANSVNDTEYSLLVQGKDDNPIASGGQMPLFATICHNCGFVRLFSKFQVEHNMGEE